MERHSLLASLIMYYDAQGAHGHFFLHILLFQASHIAIISEMSDGYKDYWNRGRVVIEPLLGAKVHSIIPKKTDIVAMCATKGQRVTYCNKSSKRNGLSWARRLALHILTAHMRCKGALSCAETSNCLILFPAPESENIDGRYEENKLMSLSHKKNDSWFKGDVPHLAIACQKRTYK